MTKNYPTIKKLVPLFFSLFAFSAFSQTVITDNIPGTKNFTVPCGVTSITVEAWGGGGGGQKANGNPSAGGGGSGGGYVKTTIAVTAGNNYSYFVGSGGSGNSGVNGTATWFINSATINAVGGVGAGTAITANNSWGTGATAPNTGNAGGTTVNSYGGNGGNAGNNFSGGGGSSGGSSASNDANGINGGAAPTDGYVGADGRNSNGGGANGNIGAGGAGGRTAQNTNRTGGSGGNGQIRITYTSTFQTYCSPTFTSGVEPITNVTFAGINNTTTEVLGGANLESFCDIGTVVQGTTHQISLKGNTDGSSYTDDFRVFIDWNQNGNFSDTGESYYIGTITGSTGIDSQTLIGNIAVPATATLGNTRMRVMKRWNADPTNPCQTGSGYGQAEDYTINVTAPSDTYCTSFGNTDYQTAVTSVSFNTFNNIDLSPKVVGYKDYTTISTIVTKGLSYDLSVNVNTDGNYTNYTYAWIDWNQDGDFNDMGESYDLGIATNVSNGATLNSPLLIPVPATASIGLTRMRVSTKYFSAPIPCGAGFDGEVEDYTINIVNPPNIWNGSISTDWNIAGNWSVGVPTIGFPNTLDVVIPAGLSNYPVIAAGAVAGYVENIVFESGATLNVVDNSLRVTDNLTLNGKIDLNGESQLLQDLGSVFDAASTGSIEMDQQGTGNSFRYNYWSAPVNSRGTKFTIGEVLRDGTDPNAVIKPIIDFGTPFAYADGVPSSPIKLSSYWMYKLENSGLGYSAWFRIGNTGEILVGQGYTMKGSNTSSAEQNYIFTGKPNNGTIELTVAKDNDYLVGNPYPSAIDADQFLTDNNPSGTASITGAIYFWEHYGGDTHNLEGYQGGYATYSLGGGVQASAFPGLGGGISVKGAPGQFIPVGQAFFVVGDAVDGGQIQFNNGQRVFVKESELDVNGDPISVFMKSNNTKSKTDDADLSDFRPKFRIGFDAPKISHRQLLFTIDERATKAVDWGFDAEIYEIFADDMYWMLNNKKYVIQAANAVGLNSEVPLGIQLSKTGIATVKIDALENVDDDTSIYLKDKLTGESFNMRDKPVQLNLTAGKYADRFVLVFKTQKLVAEDVVAEVLIPATAQPVIEGMHVFMNNALGELQIKNNSTEEITSVVLINAVGQTVNTWNSNFNTIIISLPVNTATGVYLVQINTKKGTASKKIVVD